MRKLLILSLVTVTSIITYAQKVDYSVVSVPEESGTDFMKMTKDGDYVAMPLVKRSPRGVEWLTNRILDISADGSTVAYISTRNNASNIFIKDLSRQGSAIQRTNRANVLDFSYSPDGKQIVFSEAKGRTNQIFMTDASNGYVCRQITSSDRDYSPVFSNDKSKIYFCRAEQRGFGIWGYDIQNNFLSSFFPGMGPCPVPGEDAIIVSRVNAEGKGEIWKINYSTGVEECLISNPNHSFSTPNLSPDGQWLLFVGDGQIVMPNGGTFYNADIFAARTDGTQLTQLTYHAADDLSPVWGKDGNYIYFISQRGDANGLANIWRMSFNPL